MRNVAQYPLIAAVLGFGFVIAPAIGQTPEPAAGNPAISSTPAPSSGKGATPMASPSNEANIPKGSNPEGGSGNLGASSGATPSSSAVEQPTPSQTANNPETTINDNAPSAKPSGAAASGGAGGESGSSAGGAADNMPQGRYASPPNVKAP